ncbi:hypothetical protein LCGC14_1441110 [marine sediment metagenome]|uniref:Uncharacterized protein n=1 Tax=marine sediment metagenome TaxID=412755 RepID=A0A0F9K6X2_9ZZZZ
MASLNSQTIARLFTLTEIETKITFYTNALEGATVRSYSKDSSQGSQRVDSAEIDKIESLLQTYLKAKEILSGLNGTQIVSTNFTDRRRAGIL